MIEQLASLQNGMSTLITQNQEIYKKLVELPVETNAIRYRGLLVGALRDYKEELLSSDILRLSLKRRLTNAETLRVRSLTDRLRSVRNEMIGSGIPLDPLLGMALCSSCMAEIQGLSILSDNHGLATVRESTRDVLDASLKNYPGSAGAVLASCEKELNQQDERVKGSSIWKTGEFGRAAIALDVQDYDPGRERVCHEFPHRGPDGIEFISRCSKEIPSRTGDLVRVWSDVSIRRVSPIDVKEIRDRLPEEAISSFKKTKAAERFFLEQVEYDEKDVRSYRKPTAQDAAKVPKEPQKISFDLKGAKADRPFQNVAGANPSWKAQADLVTNPKTGLRRMVDEMNLIRARREIALQAVDTIKSTIATLDTIGRA